jgi:hypothetical protein
MNDVRIGGRNMKTRKTTMLLFAMLCTIVMSMPNALAANIVSNVEFMDSSYPPHYAFCSDVIAGYTVWPNDWTGANTQDLSMQYNPGDWLVVMIQCTATNNDPTTRVAFSFGLHLYTRQGWINRLGPWAWDVWTPMFQMNETGVKVHTLMVVVAQASDHSPLWIADYTCQVTAIVAGGFVTDTQNYWIKLV